MSLADYGHNVRVLRRAKGLTQRVGFTPTTICKVEQSHNGVGLRLAALTAEALGVTVDTLIGPRLEVSA